MQKSEVSVPLTGGINTRAGEFALQPPQMAESVNSSLNVTTGEIGRPTTLTAVDGLEPPRAVAVSSNTGNIAAYPGADNRQRVINAVGAQVLSSTLQPDSEQNVWRPWMLTHASTQTTPGGAFYSTVCETSLGHIVKAVLCADVATSTVRLIVSATDANHRVVLQPQVLAAGLNPKLVAIGSSAHLSFIDTSARLCLQSLTWTGTTFTVGSIQILTTAFPGFLLLAKFAACVSGDAADDGIYYCFALASSATTVRVGRWDISSGLFSFGNTYALSRDSTDWNPGIDAGSYSGVIRVCAAWADTSGVDSVVLDETGATQMAQTTWTGTQFRRVVPFVAFKGGVTRQILAYTSTAGSFAGPTITSVLITDLAGAYQTGFDMNSCALIANEAAACTDGGERVPVFAVAHCTDEATSEALSSVNYVSDPSIELVQVNRISPSPGFGELWFHSPVARLGVDRASIQSLSTYRATAALGNGAGHVHAVFSKDARIAVEHNQVEFDLAYPARVAYSGTAAIIAAAQPVSWDGAETTELGGPLHKVTVGPIAGTTGSPGIKYRALIVYRDASGALARGGLSDPSVAYTVPPTGFRVSMPDTFKLGRYQDFFGVEIYSMDETDGRWILTSAANANPTSVANTYDATATGTIDYSFPALFSDGGVYQELLPEAPPAMWDAAFVSGRAWYIDAAQRSAAGFSKPPQQGVRIEFNAVNRMQFPAEAGQLIAVQDMGGNAVFIAENGAYVVLGDGPDANGNGLFNQPRLAVATKFHPDSRNVTVRTPAGIFCRTLRGYALLGPDFSLKMLDAWVEPAATLRSTAVVLEATSEVALIPNGTGAPWAVYNYALDAWTTWDYSTMLADVLDATLVYGALVVADPSVAEDRLYVFTDDGCASGARESDAAFLAPWSVSSPWVQPAGVGGRCSFSSVLLYLRLATTGTAGIRVRLYHDYEATTATTDVSFTAAQLALESVGNLTQLRIKTSKGSGRAIKIVVSCEDAPYNDASPLSVTFEFTAEPGSNVRASSTLRG